MTEKLLSAIVRVFGQNEKVLGSGFFVTSKHIVTCSHVLGSNTTTGESVTIDTPFNIGNEKRFAQIIFNDIDVDIAVLEIKDIEGRQEYLFLDELKEKDVWGNECRVFGFSIPSGVWATGIIRGHQAYGMIQIDQLNTIGELIDRGFSGAPVFNKDQKQVIGIVQSIHKPANSAFIIPSDKINSILRVLGIKSSISFNVKYVHSAALPRVYASRENEINEIIQILSSEDNRIVLVKGIGGAGKTTVARKILEVINQAGSVFNSALWYSFYRDDDVDHFLVESCRLLIEGFDPSKYPSPFSKTLLLKEVLSKKRILFVLDGFELMQEKNLASSNYGVIKHKAIKDLLLGVCEEQTITRILMTSRAPLTEFQDLNGYYEFPLNPLINSVATKYLQETGVAGTEKELSNICEVFGNHPLTLSVLADYLKILPSVEDVEKINELRDFSKDTPQGEKLNKILDGYWETLNLSEKYFISRLSLLRSGAKSDMLQLLSANNLGEPCGINHPEFRATIRRLRQSSLVSIEGNDKIFNVTIHPLIQQNVKSNISKEIQKHIHLEFSIYYEKEFIERDEYYSLRDIQSLINRYYHLIYANEYDAASQLMLDSNLRLLNRLLWWGHYWLAYELFLMPLITAYENGTWASSQEEMSYIYRQAGNIMAKTKGTYYAEQLYNKAVAVVEGNDNLAARPIQYLSELLAEAGRFQDAYRTIHRLTQINNNLEKKIERYRILGREGYINAGLGNVNLAKNQLLDAIQLSSDPDAGDDGYLCLFLRVLGDLNYYCKDYDSAIHYYKAAVRIAKKKKNNYTDYVGHILRGFGDVFRAQGKINRSEYMYKQALFIAQNTGYIWLEAEVKIGLSLLNLEAGDVDAAESLANSTLRMLPSRNWLVPETQAYIILANIKAISENILSAKQYLDKADELCSQSHHFWTKKQVEKIKTEIMDGR